MHILAILLVWATLLGVTVLIFKHLAILVMLVLLAALIWSLV